MYIITNPLYIAINVNSFYVWSDRRDYRKFYSQKFLCSLTIKLFLLPLTFARQKKSMYDGPKKEDMLSVWSSIDRL